MVTLKYHPQNASFKWNHSSLHIRILQHSWCISYHPVNLLSQDWCLLCTETRASLKCHISANHLQKEKGFFFFSTGPWCCLKVSFVYFLLKGRRLNTQRPQLSAGNEHLATEEEGSCDLETDRSVGGMTLASLAGPDLHAKVPKAMKKPRKGNAYGPSSVLFRPVKIFW